jgi:hypothetical protein
MGRSSRLLAVLPLLGLGELGAHAYFATRAPSFEDYAALAPRLVALKRPDMPVVASPGWAEPLLRQAAPQAFPLTEVARPDDAGFASFLEVSLPSVPQQSGSELAHFLEQSEEQVGPFRLRILKNPRFEPRRFDFVTALEAGLARVSNAVEGELLPCPLTEASRSRTGGLHGPVARPRRYHACREDRAVAVTVIEDQGYRARRCMLIEAPSRGSVVLEFQDVPASAKLVGFAGFPYFLERDAEGAQVELTLGEGGHELGRHRVEAARGWVRFDVPRPNPRGDVTVDATWRVEPPRELCLALEAR